VLGHADIKGGYPDARIDRLGQPASEYEFHFADESVEVCRLLHGVHVLRANIVLPPERGRGWRACPEAPEIIPALQIELDPSFETLRLNLWQKKFTSPAPLTMIRWRLKDPESVQLLAAISLQEK
jgi:hypothetical protein